MWFIIGMLGLHLGTWRVLFLYSNIVNNKAMPTDSPYMYTDVITPSRLFIAAPKSAGTVCNVLSYGARADGITPDTIAITKAITACTHTDTHTTILFPGYRANDSKPLTYLTSPFEIGQAANLTLRVEKGAVVMGSPVDSDYGGSRCGGSRVLVCVYNLTNLRVYGGGTFDGNGLAGEAVVRVTGW